jgi:shikimate dehydrogenase
MSLRFAVIGNPIAHSLSPQIHEAFAAQTGIALTYERIEAAVAPDATPFVDAVRKFFSDGGAGMNVTAPFKQPAFSFADDASRAAAHAQAANTLSVIPGTNHWNADNTDGPGLARDLERNLGSLSGAKILIHGAGGAVAGVLHALLASGATVSLINRTVSKAEALAKAFEGEGVIHVLQDWSGLSANRFDVVVNATSGRVLREGETLWPDALFSREIFYYDLVYAQEDTAFLRWVKTRASAEGVSARVKNGLGMLIEQAAESFRIWHGVMPETEPVHRKLGS